jgi:alkylglycerol monooxygenase
MLPIEGDTQGSINIFFVGFYLSTCLTRLLMKGFLYTAYIYLYDNYRIYTLPWDSIWTWIIAAIGYDLGYYWVHRAAHGIYLKSTHQPVFTSTGIYIGR